jgi:GTP cyclohydrolase FolE2
VKVQAILENACYTFGHKMMGEILLKEGWDCPESVELNVWASVFRRNEVKFDPDKLHELGKPFPEFLDSIAQLRHTAVHRVRVSANRVQQFMVEAESLANILHDNVSARMLSCLRREAQQIIDELGRNKDLLESILKEKLQEIDSRRRELDSLERKAVEEMLRGDKEYQTIANANFEQAISTSKTLQKSPSTSDHETSSETDVEVESFERSSFGQVGESTSICSEKPISGQSKWPGVGVNVTTTLY